MTVTYTSRCKNGVVNEGENGRKCSNISIGDEVRIVRVDTSPLMHIYTIIFDQSHNALYIFSKSYSMSQLHTFLKNKVKTLDVPYYRDQQNIALIHYIQKYPFKLGPASWKTENGAKK